MDIHLVKDIKENNFGATSSELHVQDTSRNDLEYQDALSGTETAVDLEYPVLPESTVGEK